MITQMPLPGDVFRTGSVLDTFLPTLEHHVLQAARRLTEAREFEETGSNELAEDRWERAGRLSLAACDRLNTAMAGHGIHIEAGHVLAIVKALVEAHAMRFTDQARSLGQVDDGAPPVPTSGS